MPYKKQVINNLSTIDVISAKLDIDLKSFFTRTTSITIVVHNNDQSSLHNKTHEEFEKYIASIELKIHTLDMMMENILKVSGDHSLVKDIKSILNSVKRDLKQMSYKIFSLRKAIETNNIIELRVVSDSFTADINNLRINFKNLKETAVRIKIELSLKEEQ